MLYSSFTIEYAYHCLSTWRGRRKKGIWPHEGLSLRLQDAVASADLACEATRGSRPQISHDPPAKKISDLFGLEIGLAQKMYIQSELVFSAKGFLANLGFYLKGRSRPGANPRCLHTCLATSMIQDDRKLILRMYGTADFESLGAIFHFTGAGYQRILEGQNASLCEKCTILEMCWCERQILWPVQRPSLSETSVFSILGRSLAENDVRWEYGNSTKKCSSRCGAVQRWVELRCGFWALIFCESLAGMVVWKFWILSFAWRSSEQCTFACNKAMAEKVLGSAALLVSFRLWGAHLLG